MYKPVKLYYQRKRPWQIRPTEAISVWPRWCIHHLWDDTLKFVLLSLKWDLWGWQTQDGQPGLLMRLTFHHRLINWSEQSHLGVTQTRWVQRSNPRSVWQQETNTMESRWAHNISLHLHFWLFDLLFDSTWNMDDCKYMWHFYYVNKGEQYSLFQEVTPFILDHWIKKNAWKDK